MIDNSIGSKSQRRGRPLSIKPGKSQGVPDFLPGAVLCALLLAGQMNSRPEDASVLSAPIREPVQYWVEVEYPRQFPDVRGFSLPPLLAEVVPGSGGGGEKRLESGTRVRIISREPLRFRLEKMPGSHLLLFGQKIDVNRAGCRDLEAVPGIGPVLAQRIILYRQERGNFQGISELLKVRGIGPKSLSKISEYLTITVND